MLLYVYDPLLWFNVAAKIIQADGLLLSFWFVLNLIKKCTSSLTFKEIGSYKQSTWI